MSEGREDHPPRGPQQILHPPHRPQLLPPLSRRREQGRHCLILLMTSLLGCVAVGDLNSQHKFITTKNSLEKPEEKLAKQARRMKLFWETVQCLLSQQLQIQVESLLCHNNELCTLVL